MKTSTSHFKTFFIALLMMVTHAGLRAQDPQEGWNFVYPGDDFTDDALLDLRYLNEEYAGENGFLQLSEDGNSFVDGEGNPMRLWCINGGGLAKKFSDDKMKKFARFLAKMGVNMIRFHGSINPAGKGTKIYEVDTAEVNAIWKMVAFMKDEGIYSTISPFWAHNGHMGGWVPEEWGIEGYSGKDGLWGVMYFSDTLKQAYKTWVEYLYTETNPYTGIALKDDPAVGLIQVKNEDGVFFWTIQSVHEPINKVIRQKYYNWLVEKYGSIEAAQEVWGNVTLEDDNPAAGEMDIYIIWFATQNQSGGLDKRLTDQIEFMAHVQRDFYQEMYDYYRELGCNQLINATNWKTANAARLLDTERWTNAAADVIAVNRYYSPGHTGENSGWRIDPGHHYVGKSALVQPNELPINIKQPEGHPVVVTESGWNLPHKYQAEGPFLISAYMSLTGVDGFYWFSPSDWAYDTSPYYTWTKLEGGQHPLSRWTNSIPGQIGMFPANALLFRKGYLQEGETAVYEGRTLESMWKREIPVITEKLGFDPNRDTQIYEGDKTDITPLAYLTGKVFVEYDTENDSSAIHPEMSSLIDFESKKVKSSTGELEWDYNNGICKMDAPSAQGVTGFVGKEGTFELTDVSIETTNDYAAINVVSMDEKSIAESSSILVQVGTVYRPLNWAETATEFEQSNNTVSGFRIDNTGKMPWKSANTLVTVHINNPQLNQATVLDAAGYAKTTVDLVKNGESVQLELPEDAMYVVLSNTTSTNSTKQNNFLKVYPNPNNGIFRIEIPQNRNKRYDIEIRNMLGQKIWEKTKIEQSEIVVRLNESFSGLCIVTLKENNIVVGSQKLRVE